MKNALFIFSLALLVSCGNQGKNGKNGRDGATIAGINGSSTGVDFEDIYPGLACATGGVSIFTFRDVNADGVHDIDESILKVKALCNGTNGANGSDGTNGADGQNASITIESVASSVTCPAGGVKITSGSALPVEICNGVNGLNGEQGIQGVQGIPGMAGSNGINGTNGTNGIDGTNGTNGTNGTIVTPVKFCSNDNSTFPEYGLMIGSDLYAVYWGTTPASPNKPQAFLTKLVAGNYQSTGGNNCLFSVR
jgi:hypothetical protein